MKKLRIIFYISLTLGCSAILAASRDFNSPLLYGLIIIFTLAQAIFRKSGASLFWIVSIMITLFEFIYKANPLFLFAYLAFSMVCWDLAILEKSLGKQKEDITMLINLRTKSVIIVAVLSFIIIFLVQLIQLDLPFYALLITAFAVLLSLFNMIRLLKTHGAEIKD